MTQNGDGHVRPMRSPASWGLARTGEQVTPDGQRESLWALTIYTVAGQCETTWTGPSLLRFADRLREQVIGLTIASELPPELPRFGP